MDVPAHDNLLAAFYNPQTSYTRKNEDSHQDNPIDLIETLAGVDYLNYFHQSTQIKAGMNRLSLCCSFYNLICVFLLLLLKEPVICNKETFQGF